MATDLKFTDNASNFPTFLVTPYGTETDDKFKNALILPDAPGRAICMSQTHFKEARKGYDSGKIYKDSPCEEKGFSLFQVTIITVVTLIVGLGLGQIVRVAN